MFCGRVANENRLPNAPQVVCIVIFKNWSTLMHDAILFFAPRASAGFAVTKGTGSSAGNSLRSKAKIVGAALFIGVLTLSCSLTEAQQEPYKSKVNKEKEMLTPVDECNLRNAVYYKGLSTVILSSGRQRGHRIAIVPQDIVDLHSKKRLATLALLLDIVKGGAPPDALAAAGFAIALEDSPIAALSCVDCTSTAFDELVGNENLTFRRRLVRWLSEVVEKLK